MSSFQDYIGVTRWVVSVSLCVGASQRIPLSVLVRNALKGPERETSCETASARGKEGLREDRELLDKAKQKEAVKR